MKRRQYPPPPYGLVPLATPFAAGPRAPHGPNNPVLNRPVPFCGPAGADERAWGPREIGRCASTTRLGQADAVLSQSGCQHHRWASESSPKAPAPVLMATTFLITTNSTHTNTPTLRTAKGLPVRSRRKDLIPVGRCCPPAGHDLVNVPAQGDAPFKRPQGAMVVGQGPPSGTPTELGASASLRAPGTA